MKVLFKIGLLLLPVILGCHKTVTINGHRLEYLSAKEPRNGYCYLPFERKECETSSKGVRDVGELMTKLSLKLIEEPIPIWNNKYVGYKLVLINKSDMSAEFPTQDNRLWIYREAQDKDGNWKPIENLPPSGCGNSYYPGFICAQDSVVFAVPKYQGNFKTMLRFKLMIDNESYVLSNVFSGSVNENQFSVYDLTEPW